MPREHMFRDWVEGSCASPFVVVALIQAKIVQMVIIVVSTMRVEVYFFNLFIAFVASVLTKVDRSRLSSKNDHTGQMFKGLFQKWPARLFLLKEGVFHYFLQTTLA